MCIAGMSWKNDGSRNRAVLILCPLLLLRVSILLYVSEDRVQITVLSPPIQPGKLLGKQKHLRKRRAPAAWQRRGRCAEGAGHRAPELGFFPGPSPKDQLSEEVGNL